jgi:hypothetical protein
MVSPRQEVRRPATARYLAVIVEFLRKGWSRPAKGRYADNPLYRGVSRGLAFTWFAAILPWCRATWAQIAGFAARIAAGGWALATMVTAA